MKLGTTFSHHQVRDLGCSVSEAFDQAIEMKFDYLRICTYWNEVETSEGQYDWSSLAKILNTCQRYNQDVVLTLGVKSPRWPEFYFPNWVNNKNLENKITQQQVLNFIKQTINKFKHLSCIKYYQVENEALDKSGADDLTVPISFLTKEIQLTKKLDTRPIVTTLWGNDLSKRNFLPKLAKISDVVGLDLYYQQFITQILGKSIYKRPADKTEKIKNLLEKSPAETWIMELQAEPWEANERDYLAKNPRSISPGKIKSFYHQARQLPVSTIFFWGFEYWFYQLSQNNDNSYFESISEIAATVVV